MNFQSFVVLRFNSNHHPLHTGINVTARDPDLEK